MIYPDAVNAHGRTLYCGDSSQNFAHEPGSFGPPIDEIDVRLKAIDEEARVASR